MISEAAIMDPDRTTDTESRPADPLLLRARDGDSAAFEALLRRHERLVFGTAWRCLQGQGLQGQGPTRPLAARLYRVTVNVCRTLRRKRRVRPTVPLGDAAETLIAPGADPAAAAELVEEQKMVAQGLETLARKERTALVLHDIEGLSTLEVASTLGVTEVTVRSHLCRARLKMRTFRERWLRRM